ncbi:MAG: beta-galactosidase, partial [Lentisphaeria bacterium]|nr:beta-galactosidase [Lentisphaeria bacterium]
LPQGGVWQQDKAVETKGFTPSQPLGVTVRLAESATEPLGVRITLADSLDRVLAEDQATMAAGSTELTVTFPPQALVDQGVEVMVELSSAGRVIDVSQQRAVAYRPRVWNRFWYTSWGGQYLWRTKYLFDYNNRLVRDFGVDVSFWGDTEIGTGKVRDNAFWGVNHSYLGLLSYLGRGVPNFMDKALGTKMAKYAKTGDKAQLERTPCLVDPEWREAMRKKLVDRVQPMMAAGGCYDYCMGDEMSLTSYTKFHDYDWSPASLVDFRRWLKTRHANLAALNKAWDTAFATWDAVLPLTREEAREAANPAPWFEFRSYMNTQLADLYRFIVKAIRDIDPHAQCGLSGTQSPEAGNGMDWWKQAFSFGYYHSYNTSWSNEMRRSFQYVGGAEQSPYFSGYSARNPGAENRMWWCLFHDTRGISAWKTGLFFHGDFSKTRSGVDTQGHLRSFRRGIWRLLRGAKRQHDGIAIYYSMPTIITGALTGETKKINAARDAWVKILEDCGLQYEFVSGEQVAAGFLRKDGAFKAVVLPYTLALSQAESEALHSFVKTGGALLATRPIGVRDEMGRPQKPSLLADVFGAKIDGPPQPMPQSATLEMAI